MREITQEMIDIFNIKNLRYDFMGYTFKNIKDLSFHHLVIPHKDCKANGLGDGYLIWNGAILKQETSHDYLHVIERIKRDYFLKITKFMMDMNNNKQIDMDNLKRIREVLLLFEEEHQEDTNKKGMRLIKKQYIKDRIDLL